MPKSQHLTVISTTWAQSKPQLEAVRTPVFIIEQLVAPEFEWDEKDEAATHLLAILYDEPVGCARIVGNKIQRMAVLQNYRQQGVGLAILQKAVEIIKKGDFKTAKLSAQTHAIGFYLLGGFVVTSEVYQDLHIPHVDMEMTL
jgi:predicted GNAT family N-acyltransferase